MAAFATVVVSPFSFSSLTFLMSILDSLEFVQAYTKRFPLNGNYLFRIYVDDLDGLRGTSPVVDANLPHSPDVDVLHPPQLVLVLHPKMFALQRYEKV